MINLKKAKPFIKCAILASAVGIAGGCQPRQHSHPLEHHNHNVNQHLDTASNADRNTGIERLPINAQQIDLDDKCFIRDDFNLRTMPIEKDEWVAIDINDDGGFTIFESTDKHIADIDGLYSEYLSLKGVSATRRKGLLKLDSSDGVSLEGFTQFLKDNNFIREAQYDQPGHFELNLKQDTKIWFALLDDKWEFPTHGVFNVNIHPAKIKNGKKVPFAFSSVDFPPNKAKKLVTINYKSVKSPLENACEYKYDLRVNVVNGGFNTTIIIDPPIKDDGTGH